MGTEQKALAPGGFSYYVSDEQMAAFARLTPWQRLLWVEAAREFTLLAQTPQTRSCHENLRQGRAILGEER